MKAQNIFNTVILLLVLALLYHGVQLNTWVVENRDRIETIESQPSELERCIVANTEPTPINNYIIKKDEHNQKLREIMTKYYDNDETMDFVEPYLNEVSRFAISLNALEDIVGQCDSDKFDADDVEGLAVSEQEEYRKEIIQSCMLSTANEVKELQLKIEAENTEKAKSICHSQGIY